MPTVLSDRCPQCGNIIPYTEQATELLCPYCGHSFLVVEFVSERLKMEQAQAESAKAREALAAAEAERAALQARLNGTLSALHAIENTQRAEDVKLDGILDSMHADRKAHEAMADLLRAIQQGQQSGQDALSQLLRAMMKEQADASGKLSAVQELSAHILHAHQSGAEAMRRMQDEMLERLDAFDMQARDRMRLYHDFRAWIKSMQHDDVQRLQKLQAASNSLLREQQATTAKLDGLSDAIAHTQAAVRKGFDELRRQRLDTLIELYHQATGLQHERKFDKAEETYRKLLATGGADAQGAEVYWRMLLCHYGVEYQQAKGESIPVILRPDLSDPSTMQVRQDLREHIKSAQQKAHYAERLEKIDFYLQRYRTVRLDPAWAFDVFISVKQSDQGHYTQDSDRAADLYYFFIQDKALAAKKLRVFNSRFTPLPVGEDFEPYIIAALMSAKVLIVVGSTPEHMNAQWVKNEWSRFQYLQEREQQHGKTDRRLFCCLTGGMQPKDLPMALNPDKQVLTEGPAMGSMLRDIMDKAFPDKEAQPPMPRPDAKTASSKKWWMIAIAVVSLCLLIGVAIHLIGSGNTNQAPPVSLPTGDQTVMSPREYQAAGNGYGAPENDEDSAARALLDDILIDLQQGRPDAAAAKLDQLTSEGEGDKAQPIHASMANEVRTAISEWRSRGIPPADVPALIRLAEDRGMDLSGIHRDAVYEEAALASAGHASQHAFVDWNADGYEELLTLDASGKLSLYGMDEAWKVVSFIDTKWPGCSFTIADESAPLILVLSSGQDELLAVTGTSAKLSSLFRQQGISRYQASGSTVTFSQRLEGSIDRYSDFTYEAVGTTNRPVRTGIDWQQQDYPQPMSAMAAIQRYFEARAYDIPEEADLLTEEAATPGLFETAKLAALAIPDAPGAVNAVAYQTEDDLALFEVTYPAGAQTIRTWVAAAYINGWKVIGAADTYGAGQHADDVDYAIELISLNAEVSHTLSEKGSRHTYRLLIPTSGRLRLVWQSGTKAASRTSHTITMVHGALTGDTVFSFDLQPSLNKQQSKDMFVAAGVYYVTVEAKVADAAAYRLAITFAAEANVELEGNSTAARATPMALNAPYSGTLSSAKDVDFFSFTLEETSAVNVTLGTPGNGSKSTTHTYAVFHAADGDRLSTVSMPGNAQLTETGNLYLSPGTYLVRVAKGSAYTNDEYMLTVNVSQNGTMESEANNTPETADAVPVNEDIHASIGQEGDIDCFTFTLDGDAVVQPRFTFKPTDSASKTYVLTLMDGSRRELLKANIGGKESTKVIAPVALTAGTYTVRIENPRFIRQDYTLRLVRMAVDAAEKEPNDSLALATDLLIGSARTGVLTSDADIDCYKLTFAEQTTVTLRFSFAQSTSKHTAFVMTVEQNGRTQWTANIKGDSGGMEQRLQFPAGEYYIKVKPSTWLSAVYTIAVD